MRRSETVRLEDSADAQPDDDDLSQWQSDELGGVSAPPERKRGRGRGGRWWRNTLLVLSTLLLAVVIVSGSLALSTYVFASHQPGRAGRPIGGAGTSTATASPTSIPAATATATTPAQRVSSVSSNIPAPPPCTPSGSHPIGVIGGTGASGEVALTFDDGPTPYSTPAILNVLEQTHTAATFFVLGQYVTPWPYLLQREINDGFAIGIHTWSHPDMTTLSPSQQYWQLTATQQAIRNVMGASSCPWFWRPPYGSYNQQVLQMAASLHLTTIMWDDDPADWSQPGTSVIVQRVLSEVHAGSIVLMHDGPAFRQETADALPQILAGLKARGLRPVTVPQLLADGGYAHVAVPSAATAANASGAPPADSALPASLLARDAAQYPPRGLPGDGSLLAPGNLPGGQPSAVTDILIQPGREPVGNIREAGVGDSVRHVVLKIGQGDG